MNNCQDGDVTSLAHFELVSFAIPLSAEDVRAMAGCESLNLHQASGASETTICDRFSPALHQRIRGTARRS